MRVQEAKDFLVQQAEEQAQLESVPLAELEKRMMYFTEGPDAIENPITLNEEFEEQFNTSEYEPRSLSFFAMLTNASSKTTRAKPVYGKNPSES